MANQSFSEDLAAKRCAMRAGMLSASFERWRRNHHPYPIHLPGQLQQVLPLPMRQVTPLVVRASDNRRTLSCVCRGIDSDLEGCSYPELDRFRAVARQAYRDDEYFANPNGAQAASDDDLIDEHESTRSHTDIEFDPDSFITTVTASSYFPEVNSVDAKRIIDAADPPNWKVAVPSFFLESNPGIWKPEIAAFDDKNPPKDTRVGSYQLEERVEWNWSPQLIGGVINILNIENKDVSNETRNADPASELIDGVKNKLGGLEKHLQGTHRSSSHVPDATFRHYAYRLIRCVQSKFVSSWQRGGLDVDEGYYKAAWVPQKADFGTLVIQARKSVHYSDRADVIPGLASMLNLMAPAITSLLMRNLGYRGVRDDLKHASSSSSPATGASQLVAARTLG